MNRLPLCVCVCIAGSPITLSQQQQQVVNVGKRSSVIVVVRYGGSESAIGLHLITKVLILRFLFIARVCVCVYVCANLAS